MANQFSDRSLPSPSIPFIPGMLPISSPSATPRPRTILISSPEARSAPCTIPTSIPASVSRMAPIYAPTPTYPSNFVSSSSPSSFSSSPLCLVYSPSLPTSSPPTLFGSHFSSRPIPLVLSPVSSVISPPSDSSPSRSHMVSPPLISFSPSPSSTSPSPPLLFSTASVSSSASTSSHVTPFVPPVAEPTHESSPINDPTIPMASPSLPQGFNTHPHVSPSVPYDFESFDDLSFASSFPCSPTEQSVSPAYTARQDGLPCLPQTRVFDSEAPRRIVINAHLDPLRLSVNSKVDLRSCFDTSVTVSSLSARPPDSTRNDDLALERLSVSQHFAPALRSSDSQHPVRPTETVPSPRPISDHKSRKLVICPTELSVHDDDSQSFNPRLENAANHPIAAVVDPESVLIRVRCNACAEHRRGTF